MPKKIRSAEERLQPDATSHGRALRLTDEERLLLKQQQLVNQALILFTESSKTLPEVAQELGMDPEELQRFSTSAEYPVFREAVAERAAMLYLDLDKDWGIAEIAAQLGMTTRQLRHFTRSTAFLEKYQEIFARISDDPGPRAAQLKVVERLLPLAMKTLEEELTSGPWTVRQKARQDVFRLAGVEAISPQESDRQEAAKFLTQVGQVTVNVTVPAEYQEAMTKWLPNPSGPSIVEGDFRSPDQDTELAANAHQSP